MSLVLRRIGHALPLLVAVSGLAFALIHAAPGGPLELYLSNPNVRPEDIARLRSALGLDRPLPEQYLRWLSGVARGEWGYSLMDGRPVLQRITERLPATLELVLAALGMSLAAAVPAAVVSARGRPRWLALVLQGAAVAGISLPVFWLGLALQLVFAVWLGWLPAAGRASLGDGGLGDRLQHLVLPAVVLAAVHAAAWMRYLRSSLADVLPLAFVRAARARGLSPRRVLWGHALRTAWEPFVTVAMLDAALLLSGAVVTESVFAWPGLGTLFTDAIARRDYPVLMAFLMLAAAVVVVANLLADLVQARLDPRSR